MRSGKFIIGIVTVLGLTGAVAFGSQKTATITVTDNSSGLSAPTTTSGFSSHFTASGCGFKANDSNYELVVRGPGQFTSSLTYWVDAFPVGLNGCGRASPSWSGSGMTGYFDVYVVRSPSGNATQAQPASNVVTIYISNP
jgi:hypothetical protein